MRRAGQVGTLLWTDQLLVPVPTKAKRTRRPGFPSTSSPPCTLPFGTTAEKHFWKAAVSVASALSPVNGLASASIHRVSRM